MPSDISIPLGLCQCGCGQKTTIAPQTVKKLGYVKGEPRRFLAGHGARQAILPADIAAWEAQFINSDIPAGYCQCGCGEKTRIAPANSREDCAVRGRPVRFVRGHHWRKPGGDWLEDPKTGCWLWQRSFGKKGYGVFPHSHGEPYIWAHKAIYEQRVRRLEPGEQLHHLCEIKQCVNPDHMAPLSDAAHRYVHGMLEMTEDDYEKATSALRESLRVRASRSGNDLSPWP